MDQLKNAATINDHFKVWKHDEIPKKYHYNNPRVGKILLLADPHYMFEITKSGYDPSAPHFPKGVHGYDIHTPDMHAILIGHGPYFSKDALKVEITEAKEVSNIEVYPLLASILNIKPLSHNGTDILIK